LVTAIMPHPVAREIPMRVCKLCSKPYGGRGIFYCDDCRQESINRQLIRDAARATLVRGRDKGSGEHDRTEEGKLEP
jgi:hypothetical protein